MTPRGDRQRSVNDRIRITAAAKGVDANRLRRSLVFHRVLARLGPHGFVLKGGFCLELRLPDSARATRDIDLVSRIATTTDPEQLHIDLDELLDSEADDDGFTFQLARPARLRDAGAESHAWRVSVTARLHGAEFETVKLDVVGQLDEVQGAIETLTVPPPVIIPGYGDVTVQVVDVYQHAAEKFHAYARIYAHDRPSSRVKDLVDLVLLIESMMLGDSARLRERLTVVYAERDGANPPERLPEPPRNWDRPFAALAADLDLTAATSHAAYDLVASSYAAALGE